MDPNEADDLRRFLASLPLVLERADLRVVHACWDPRALSKLPERADVAAAATEANRSVIRRLRAQGLWDAAGEERARFAGLRDPGVEPRRPLPATLAVTRAEQSGNPYKVITSGREDPIPEEEPLFYVGGKWRVVERARWWQTYWAKPAVVFGHYWRRRSGPVEGKRDLFDDLDPFAWGGPRGNVFCVDYSVGRRFLERWRQSEAGVEQPFLGGLAALRWPEKVLVFDDFDAVLPTTGFGC